MRSSITRRKFLVGSGQVAVGGSALGALLAACGGSPATPAVTSVTPETLAYWVTGYKPKSAAGTGSGLVDSATAKFASSHAKTTVNITGYTGDQAGYTKLIQAIQSGGIVDIFRVSADELPLMIQENLLSPIDDYLDDNDKSDIYPNDLSAIASNGKHYAWPLWIPPVGMYLNLDVFQERGVTPPTGDWTYEQFVEIAQKLTFTRANGDKVYGYAGMIDPGVLNTWPFIMGDGGVPFNSDNTKYTFNSDKGISGLQKLVDLAQKYHVTPPDFGGSLAGSDLITGFSQRKTYAMYSAPSGDSVTYKTAGLNFTVHAMPMGGLGTPFTTGGIGLVAVASIDDATRRKAAMDLAKYLTGAQVQQDIPGYYLAPAARKSVTVTAPVSLFSPFVSYTWLAPNIAQWGQIRTLIHPQIQKAVLGQISAADALNGPANDINTLLSGS